jgi:DNA-directed RNA polymerase subunit RPC12/RpoP
LTKKKEKEGKKDISSKGKIKCPECNKYIEEGLVFCPECGNRIPEFLRYNPNSTGVL